MWNADSVPSATRGGTAKWHGRAATDNSAGSDSLLCGFHCGTPCDTLTCIGRLCGNNFLAQTSMRHPSRPGAMTPNDLRAAKQSPARAALNPMLRLFFLVSALLIVGTGVIYYRLLTPRPPVAPVETGETESVGSQRPLIGMVGGLT